jgi:hypothetical protein
MAKYIILDNDNKVLNIIEAPTPPTDENFKDASLYPPCSRDMVYIPDEDIFISVIRASLTTDTNESEQTDYYAELLFSGSTSLGVTCSFNRSITTLPSTSLSLSSNQLDIVDYNFNTSENTSYFTLVTGSNYAPHETGSLISLNFQKQHTDSYGLKWDIKSRNFIVK